MSRMLANADVRSLTRLHSGASTSRVLNLLRVWETAESADAPITAPLFATAGLNRCFIVKHRLRQEESRVFGDGRSIATKLVLPIDPDDLRVGGRYLFLGETDWMDSLSQVTGVHLNNRPSDLRVLKALDGLPSFDPFLLRERLGRLEVRPDHRYFNLGEAEIARMESFVSGEIAELVELALRGVREKPEPAKMIRVLLSGDYGDATEPLRRMLRMGLEEFSEGMFGWKGFLYYKWICAPLEAEISMVIREMQAGMPVSRDGENRFGPLDTARKRLSRNLLSVLARAHTFIAGYDEAYAVMVKAQNPMAFRHFLLSSPILFIELGELVGVLQHVLQFWRYRQDNQISSRMPLKEYSDLILDFDSLMAGFSPS